jgi:hypothetical protein
MIDFFVSSARLVDEQVYEEVEASNKDWNYEKQPDYFVLLTKSC